MKPSINKTEFPTLWEEGASDSATITDQCDFLFELWDKHHRSRAELFVALGFRQKGSSRMLTQFANLQGRHTVKYFLENRDRHSWELFFCPNVFLRPNRSAEHAYLSRLGWCDVDDADPFKFSPDPSVVWQTSEGRSQALWYWDKMHSPQKSEAYSKALTYRHGGDVGGWSVTKFLRLPGSYNHKPDYRKPFVRLIHHDPALIAKRPQLLTENGGRRAVKSQRLELNPFAHKPLDVLKRYRRKLSTSTAHLIRHSSVQAGNRSNRIYAIVSGLHEAGATRDEIASVLWHNPYFLSKHGDDHAALETEVSRIISKLGDVK
ncbi:DNA-primase RepB domain-containing protein [Sulfitobacter sabulilitoris]|uniref:RepB-like DNA primase domain-containing protein n=1 Tax=Sulfitobacter sabulilitoris TaxID=2562655 RepID=A0A5S3PCU9_9RHOB|nr:DNA-primase RepB domain-containing protein [Sulfitobacter sabulilitoris]TMM51684.1 hypothetical protein FDT80_13075 [Sulfitobacter sabulilitoris]